MINPANAIARKRSNKKKGKKVTHKVKDSYLQIVLLL